MNRLFVTADLHGSLGTWMTVQALMKPHDQLVVAGDLFDTRYGSYSSPDFQPEAIRRDAKALKDRLHYVYGNCDVEKFYPGQGHELKFEFSGRTIFLHHGHKGPAIPGDADLIIQGHTHLPVLDRVGGQIFLNPGSMIRPRNQVPSYALVTPDHVALKELRTGKTMAKLPLAP